MAVLAKRSLGKVKVRYSINGGRTRTAPTSEWDGGERYDPPAVHYHQVRGLVSGTDPGDSVRVWFTAGRKQSRSFTYKVVSDTGKQVLVVAAEDYTGASPRQTPGPHYADYYRDALAGNGIEADVYDVDANGRVAPDHLGVLSHYDAVVWYTGDDVVTRDAARPAGNVDRLALDEMLEFRAYLNEGGKVLYTGDLAGQQFTGNVGDLFYDPKGEVACDPPPKGTDPRRCLPLGGSGDGTNDVLQYWFGGYLAVRGDGISENGRPLDLTGIDEPFAGLDWALNGPRSARNQDEPSSFVATSGMLPVDQYKQFESWPSSSWVRPGGPFEPRTGDQYVYSRIADASYKRLTREIEVPATGGSLSFWTSYDTEEAWDHLIVEARTAGGDDWTTLPDINGHTTTEPGDSCWEGWTELHPHLTSYVSYNSAAGTCEPTGTTGVWNAASGSSGGWEQWEVDLSAWSGQKVEVSIAYVSDWAAQNLGVFVDDMVLPDGTSGSFEAGMNGWKVTGPPPNSGANGNNWLRTDSSGFPVGASITTPRTVLMGFGVEGIRTRAEREAVLGRAMRHLLD